MAKLPSLAKRFDTPVQSFQQSQQITELQSEIARLRISQSPELESELEKLRTELKLQSGEQQIPLAQIDPNPEQPRQTIHIDSIVSMARSLEKDGQIAPVILIPKGDRYLLWDGQRRYEGFKYLGIETIRAVTAPMPENLHRQALLTFIHHEDLNTLDKAEAIVREIAMVTGLASHEVPTVLSTALRRLDRQKRTAELTALITRTSAEQIQGLEEFDFSPIEFRVLSVILDLTLNPASVKANLVSVLALPSDLKAAIREQGLKGTHALALALLSEKTLKIEERIATRERLEATQTVIIKDLSVRQTRELITTIKAKYLKPTVSETHVIDAMVRTIEKIDSTTIQDSSLQQLQQLETLLREKLTIVTKQCAEYL